ncbi:two-component system sensor histidine kinase NtrB [Albidovulum sp.]
MTLPAADILWTSLPLPALLVGPGDRVEEVNPAAEAFFNLSARTLRGASVHDRLAIDAPLAEAFARLRSGQGSLAINDVDVGAAGGPPHLCSLQAAPLAERPDCILLLIAPQDFADRFARRRGPRTAARSAIGMAEMLAHEIKNPLAGIVGAAQLLSMNVGPEDVELTDLIVAETRRVAALLEQVEQFGNTLPPACRAVNVHDLLDRARRSALLGFAAHVTIREDYDPSLPPTWGDPDQLLQVLLNLLRNAAEAVPREGGVITLRSYFDHRLRLRREDGSGQPLPLQLEIVDNGPGIPAEIAEHLFEPFVSGRENGTGLGLALVSKIVTAHGGWIAVDSAPGRTAFRLSLPVAPQAAPSAPAARREMT